MSRESYLLNTDENGYTNPLVGDIDTHNVGDNSLIVLPNLGFRDGLQLSPDTVRLLRELPYKHHVYLTTWT